MQKIFHIAYYLFLASVLGLGLLLALTLVPVPGNIAIKIVQSGSMEPTIKTGSIVVVKPQERYEVGDIITFGEDGEDEIPTTHRIISDEVRSGAVFFTTKGDANEAQDASAVPLSEVLGEVVLSVPYLGYVLDLARKPLGFLLLIGIPAGIVIVDEVGKIVKEVRALRSGRRKEEEKVENENE